MRPVLSAALVLLLAVPVLAQHPHGVYAFVDVTVVPMDAERLLPNHTVVVRDGEIVAVGPAAEVAVPEDARVIDGAGRFLMPGLAEMHAHLPGEQAPPELAELVLFLYVAHGITTARGMLGAPNQLALRARTASGELLGPRLILGAPSLNGTTAPDPETGRRLVREHAEAGYDFLKIHPGLRRDVYDAIVEEARAVGLTWAGHVPAEVGLAHALATGMSTIDHLDGYLEAALGLDTMELLTTGGHPFAEALPRVPADTLRRWAEATREAGVWNVPTVHLWESFFSPEPPEAFLALPEMRYATPAWRATWTRQKENLAQRQAEGGLTDADRAALVAFRRAVLRTLAETGAPLLLGTDSPQMFNVPGFVLHRELAVLAETGLSPFQILESGTRNVGRYLAEDLGMDVRVGLVAPGYRADLLLLTANPLEDVAHVARRAGVMVDGRWLPEEAIRARLEAIAAAHAD